MEAGRTLGSAGQPVYVNQQAPGSAETVSKHKVESIEKVAGADLWPPQAPANVCMPTRKTNKTKAAFKKHGEHI